MLKLSHMHYIKKFLRWVVRKLGVALLANAIAVGIPLLALSVHITNPSIVKGWLSNSNTYENVLNESLGLITLESQDQLGDSESLGETFDQNPFVSKDSIEQVISDTITPAFIESQVSGVIDGMYIWLDGTQDEPEFELSLKSKQAELGQRLTDSMLDQFNQLPACTPAELTPEFNLIEAQCRPEGIDIEREVRRFVSEFVGDEGLFGDTEWTHEDIIRRPGEDSGLDANQLQLGQQAFSGLRSGPMWLIVAGVVSTILIYFTSKSRYRGFNEIGNTLFSSSLFITITAFLATRYESIVTGLIGENDSSNATIQSARAIFEPLLQLIVHDIASLTLVFSGAVLILGSFMVGFSFYLKHRYRHEEDERLEHEWHEYAEQAKIREIKRLAKKHPKTYAHLTRDPATKKKLKSSGEKMTPHQARKLARDPRNRNKKVSELHKD